MNVCPGPCSERWRKAERAYLERGTPHDLEPKYGQPIWCESCSRAIRLSLYSLPRDAAYILLEIQYGTTPKRERVSGTPSRSLHAKESLARLIEDISGVLGDWEDDVRDALSLTRRRPRPQGPQIQHSTNFLLSHYGFIMCEHKSEATEAFGQDIGRLHRKSLKATHALEETKPQRCVGVRCPGCGWKALVWEARDGAPTGYVTCEHCDRLLTRKEYLVQVKAATLHVGLK